MFCFILQSCGSALASAFLANIILNVWQHCQTRINLLHIAELWLVQMMSHERMLVSDWLMRLVSNVIRTMSVWQTRLMIKVQFLRSINTILSLNSCQSIIIIIIMLASMEHYLYSDDQTLQNNIYSTLLSSAKYLIWWNMFLFLAGNVNSEIISCLQSEKHPNISIHARCLLECWSLCSINNLTLGCQTTNSASSSKFHHLACWPCLWR